MDLFILRDGKEIGPFTPAKAWALLDQGSVAGTDLSWCTGMAKWRPLADVLPAREPATESGAGELISTAPPLAPMGAAPGGNARMEFATPRQLALLGFLGIPCAAATSKADAALAVCEAMENPVYSVRLGQWQNERFKLFPDLFAAEIQARRENRAHHFHMLTQAQGGAWFTGLTKVQAQEVISELDRANPHWDANETTAAQEYFYPGVAARFPQLVKPAWHERMGVPAGAKGAAPLPSPAFAQPAHSRRAERSERAGHFPLGAIMRGLFFGLLILAIAIFILKVLDGEKTDATSTDATSAEPSAGAPAGASEPASPAEAAPASSAPPQPAEAAKPEMPTPPMPTTPPPPASEGSAAAPEPLAVAPSTGAMTAVPPAPLQLLRPFEVGLAYGRATLPAGTVVKFLAREGETLRVQYRQDIVLVPVSATNFAEGADE